jgi:hypothetical protein
MFEAIERLKAEWTDKYVVIDSPAAELARFAGVTGTVRTVNMNGRCLVEFDQYSNIGWYDIDPACLKIIPEPLPKPEPKAKPAPKAAAPAAKAGKPAKPAAGKRPSTADILAAARGKAAAPKPAPAKAGGKLSTAERGKAAVAPAEAPPQPEPEPAPEPEVAAEAAPEPAAETAAPAAADGPLPTTTAEKIAWCRQHDAKG